MTHPTTSTPQQQTGSTALWAAIVVLAVVVGALGSALYFVQTQKQVLHDANQQQGATPAASSQTEANKAVEAPAAKAPAEPVKPAVKKPELADAKLAKPAAKPQAAVSKSAPVAAPAPTPVAAPAPYTGEPIPAPAAARELCPTCATVVSVTPLEREPASGGVGAVAGGLLGALVGNQFGQGQGKDVATVIGAIGGGIAGNAMEKKSKKITTFQVQVRMDDGSSRSLELPEPYGVGVRVRVEGNSLRPLQ
jgi:outer membrane lipoprotein SlyB